MAQVTLCDRCERVVHLPLGDSAGCDRTKPMEVRIPQIQESGTTSDYLRFTEPAELCAGCLDSMMSWFKRDAKE